MTKTKAFVYLLISADEYALPLDLAYSIQEIARKYNQKYSTVYNNFLLHSKNSLGFYIEKVSI